MTDLEAPSAHPTREELLADFGDELFSIQSLFQFCYVPGGRITHLEERAAEEEWGTNHFVLFKYLAVHVRLAIEQGRYVWNGDQIVLAAGRLANADGIPLYLGLIRNSQPEENPWVLNWVGERPNTSELPVPPDLGEWPELDPRAEVVVACDLASEERRIHLPGLDGAPATARYAAVAGAVSWSLHRGLAVRQLHGSGRGFFVPVHLRGREDLTAAPDLAAPVLVQGDRLVVRTLLEPGTAYAPARGVVERWDQLPAWLLDAWDRLTDGEGDGAVDAD